MKTVGRNKGNADTGTDHAEVTRAARAAIRKDPDSPENYTVLAGALRMVAQSMRERNSQGADQLLLFACAAAWEAKLKSGPGLTSGRTKQELKALVAWLRIRNHITPEASESLMEQIHSEYLDQALGAGPLDRAALHPLEGASPLLVGKGSDQNHDQVDQDPEAEKPTDRDDDQDPRSDFADIETVNAKEADEEAEK